MICVSHLLWSQLNETSSSEVEDGVPPAQQGIDTGFTYRFRLGSRAPVTHNLGLYHRDCCHVPLPTVALAPRTMQAEPANPDVWLGIWPR